jgi:3D (Asp-Asp-Asp) domain-containing protein
MVQHVKETFVAFAYSPSGNLTAEGKAPIPGNTIAADPKLLPIGSRVRIDGAGTYSGEYRVGDVGGKIKGNKIDIFVASRAEAIQFGRRTVLLTVLEVPKRVARAVGTRARKAPIMAKSSCDRCDGKQPEAIITIDEARASSASPTGRSRAPGTTGDGPGQSDSRQDRSTETVAGLPDS